MKISVVAYLEPKSRGFLRRLVVGKVWPELLDGAWVSTVIDGLPDADFEGFADIDTSPNMELVARAQAVAIEEKAGG